MPRSRDRGVIAGAWDAVIVRRWPRGGSLTICRRNLLIEIYLVERHLLKISVLQAIRLPLKLAIARTLRQISTNRF